LAQKGIAEASTPALVKIMSTLTSRFGLVLTEKMAAMAVPLVGAAGGSIVNYVFMDHFQKMAEGHFIVKKLEARYGKPFVEEQYNQLPLKQK
jgi:Na+/glutamate symporter